MVIMHWKNHVTLKVAQMDLVVAAGGRLNVSLRYRGGLAELETLKSRHTEGGERKGESSKLRRSHNASECPSRCQMSFGRKLEPTLGKRILVYLDKDFIATSILMACR